LCGCTDLPTTEDNVANLCISFIFPSCFLADGHVFTHVTVRTMTITVAWLSKTYFCGRLVAGIAGSNPANGMDVSDSDTKISPDRVGCYILSNVIYCNTV
jgi:hypothetical protein